MTADEVETDAATTIGVWLELDLDTQPIEGTLSRSDGRPRPSVGWLGLTAALAGLRGAGEPAPREQTE